MSLWELAPMVLALSLAGCSATAPYNAAAIEWRIVESPDGVLRLAIVRPSGDAPMPAAIILHGRHGFAQEYVTLASDLAAQGVIGVAVCWFGDGSGEGSRFITPLKCAPGAPSIPDPAVDQRPQTIRALVQAVREMRNVSAVANYLLSSADVEAAVLNSAGYSDNVLSRAGDVHVPVLILHGTADDPGDGGSAFTQIERTRLFETNAVAAGAPVEAFYYERGRHNGIFESQSQYRDEVRRMAVFVREHAVRNE